MNNTTYPLKYVAPNTLISDDFLSSLYFSLLKMLYGFISKSRRKPTWFQLKHCILRNFGGLSEHIVRPLDIFAKHLANLVNTDEQVCIVNYILNIICYFFKRHNERTIQPKPKTESQGLKKKNT